MIIRLIWLKCKHMVDYDGSTSCCRNNRWNCFLLRLCNWAECVYACPLRLFWVFIKKTVRQNWLMKFINHGWLTANTRSEYSRGWRIILAMMLETVTICRNDNLIIVWKIDTFRSLAQIEKLSTPPENATYRFFRLFDFIYIVMLIRRNQHWYHGKKKKKWNSWSI